MSPQLALVANAEADEDAREGSLSDQRCLLRGLERRHPRHRTYPVGNRLRKQSGEKQTSLMECPKLGVEQTFLGHGRRVRC